MKFYIIADRTEKPSAVLFFDYSSAYFSVHTNSDALQKAIDTLAIQKADNQLTSSSDEVKVKHRGRNYPYWADHLVTLLVACQDFWMLQSKGDLSIMETPSSFLEKNFPNL